MPICSTHVCILWQTASCLVARQQHWTVRAVQLLRRVRCRAALGCRWATKPECLHAPARRRNPKRFNVAVTRAKGEMNSGADMKLCRLARYSGSAWHPAAANVHMHDAAATQRCGMLCSPEGGCGPAGTSAALLTAMPASCFSLCSPAGGGGPAGGAAGGCQLARAAAVRCAVLRLGWADPSCTVLCCAACCAACSGTQSNEEGSSQHAGWADACGAAR